MSPERDDARGLCQRVVDEMTLMATSMQFLHDNWDIWEDCKGTDDPEVSEQARQLYEDMTTVNTHMPGLLSDVIAGPHDVLPARLWRELGDGLLVAQQTYGHAALTALNPGEFPNEAWRAWLLVYGKANLTARRLMAEIG